MKSYIHYITLMLIMAGITSCSHTGGENADTHTHGVVPMIESEDDHMDLHLTQTQMDNIGIQFDAITQRNIRSIVKLNGRVELPTNAISVATSPLSGQVEKVHLLQGSRVQQGQVLFTLRNMELIDWQEQLVKSKAQMVYLNKEKERQQYLSREQIVAVRQLEEIEASIQKEEAVIKALESKLSMVGLTNIGGDEIIQYFEITAPQSGVLQDIYVFKGSSISPQMEMARIINLRHVRIHLAAFENDINLLSKGQKLDFFVQSQPNKVYQASIVWINNMINLENNSYEVQADILGDKSMISPGQYVQARVINEEMPMNTLPLEAITYDKGLTYIFIKESEEETETHFEKIQVQLGESDMGYTEVGPIDPIPQGAQVVTKGAFFLMAQSKKDEGGGGHEH